MTGPLFRENGHVIIITFKYTCKAERHILFSGELFLILILVIFLELLSAVLDTLVNQAQIIIRVREVQSWPLLNPLLDPRLVQDVHGSEHEVGEPEGDEAHDDEHDKALEASHGRGRGRHL